MKVNLEKLIEVLTMFGVLQGETPAAKRGRPAKKSATGKKRGRPPKAKVEAPVAEAPAPAPAKPAKKKKKKVEEF